MWAVSIDWARRFIHTATAGRDDKRHVGKLTVSDLMIRTIALIVVLQAVALGLVAAGNLVPDHLILDQVDQAEDMGHITTGWQVSPFGGIPATPSECWVLGIGIDPQDRYDWFAEIALSPWLGYCGTLIEAAHGTFQETYGGGTFQETYGGGTFQETYGGGAFQETYGGNDAHKFRYWHGLTVLSRPVVAALGVVWLRSFVWLLLVVAFIAFWREIAAARGTKAAAALLVPLAATGDPAGLANTWHHSMILASGFAGAAFLTRWTRRMATDTPVRAIWLPTFLFGSFFAFMDLMTYVPLVWALCITIAGGVPQGRELRWRAQSMAVATTAWMAGYVSMWVGKWFWAAIATSWESVITNVADRMLDHTSESGEWYQSEHFGFGKGLLRMVEYWLDRPFATVILFSSVAVIWTCALRLAHTERLRACALATPGLIVVPWALLLNPHSSWHAWFAYRSVPMMLGVVLFAFVTASSSSDDIPAAMSELP